MAYKFEKPTNMNEEWLCNTISCTSSNITNSRRQECREELMRRWRTPKEIHRIQPPKVISKPLDIATIITKAQTEKSKN